MKILVEVIDGKVIITTDRRNKKIEILLANYDDYKGKYFSLVESNTRDSLRVRAKVDKKEIKEFLNELESSHETL